MESVVSKETTVYQQLRQEWQSTIAGKGGVCPTCDRWGKINNKSIHKAMAAELAWLYQETKRRNVGDWIDVPMTAPKHVLRSNSLPSLRWWGLVEQAHVGDSKQKRSGMWRITLKGMDFVEGLLSVPRMMFYYNGAAVGFSTDLVYFKDCLDEGFDYDAMMNTTANNTKINPLKLVA